jgi:hypothetical protein
MKRFLPSRLMIFAGVLGVAAATAQMDQDVDITKIRKRFDLREAILRKFFNDNHCPAEPYAGVFVTEADAHGLDWRLLPSLSIVESGGGKYAKGNNLFGWANGKTKFGSVTEAIHHVASALAFARPYKGKDTDGKLLAYNHSTDYKAMVAQIMRQISPTTRAETGD